MMRSLAFDHEFIPGNPSEPFAAAWTGGNEHDLLNLGRALDPDAALLSPRGKVLENGMPRFFRRFAEGVFDLEDLKLRTDELADFIIGAARKITRSRRKRSWRSVTPMARTSPPAHSCYDRMSCTQLFFFAQWFR